MLYKYFAVDNLYYHIRLTAFQQRKQKFFYKKKKYS